MAALSASARIPVPPLPPIPANMSALLALCAAQDPARADQRLLPLLPNLPTVDFKIDPKLAQVSALLALGPFDFSNPLRLSAQINVMATSLNQYVAPNLQAALKLDISALLELSVVAKAIVTLKSAGLDPFSANFSAGVSALVHRPVLPVLPSALPNSPNLPNLKALAALPAILKMSEGLKVPLSDPAAASIISAKLSAIASITPPGLTVKITALLKMAAVANAIATINAALGPAALGPAGLSASGVSSISFAIKAVGALPPLPKIDLPPLEALPPVEDVILGSQIAGSGFITAEIAGLKPPEIKAAGFISASTAMQAALSAAVNAPPLAFCSNCNM
jgi:hypothetical protein